MAGAAAHRHRGGPICGSAEQRRRGRLCFAQERAAQHRVGTARGLQQRGVGCQGGQLLRGGQRRAAGGGSAADAGRALHGALCVCANADRRCRQSVFLVLGGESGGWRALWTDVGWLLQLVLKDVLLNNVGDAAVRDELRSLLEVEDGNSVLAHEVARCRKYLSLVDLSETKGGCNGTCMQ